MNSTYQELCVCACMCWNVSRAERVSALLACNSRGEVGAYKQHVLRAKLVPALVGLYRELSLCLRSLACIES